MNELKRVEIVVGFACNNRCLFCSIGAKNENKSTEQIKKEIIKAIKKDKAREINFTGGEPTIRKDIFELVEFAKKTGAKTVRVTTNGRMFSNKDFTERIARAGLNGVIFSIHGLNAETHDSLSNVKGAFIQTIKGLTNARTQKLTIDINTVVTTENLDELPELAEMLSRNFGIRSMCIIFPDIDGFLEANPWLVPSFSQAIKSIDETVTVLKKYKKTAWVLNMPPCLFEKNKDATSCSELRTKMYWFDLQVNLDENRSKGKIKLKECKHCSLGKKCIGISKKYIELKGEPKIKALK